MKLRNYCLFALLLLGGACVQDTQKTTITFVCDVSTQVDSTARPKILGNEPPLDWNKPTEMKPASQGGAYEVTLTFDLPWDELEYKYQLGDQIELYNQPNRRADLTAGDTLLITDRYDQL